MKLIIVKKVYENKIVFDNRIKKMYNLKFILFYDIMNNMLLRRVILLANKESLKEIKNYIEKHIGEEVSLVTDRGKRKMKTRVGTVRNVFRNIFTVEINENFGATRTASFSYSDVLTQDVEFIIEGNEEDLLVGKLDVL